MMTVRELRMWHWRLAMTKRALQRRHEEQYKQGANENYHNYQAKVAGNLADFHISCVQVLNDCIPAPFTSAEHDCAISDQQRGM